MASLFARRKKFRKKIIKSITWLINVQLRNPESVVTEEEWALLVKLFEIFNMPDELRGVPCYYSFCYPYPSCPPLVYPELWFKDQFEKKYKIKCY